MSPQTTRQWVDIALLSTGAGLLVAAFFASGLSKAVFLRYFGAEDSLTEDATAVALICAGVVLAARVLRETAMLTRRALALGLLYSAAYLWAGGEEISWGQRILGFASPEYFQESNDQQEVTFHNLVIGGVKLDELIFGPVLSVAILSYLILFPLFWRRLDWAQQMAQLMVIPVPRLHHAGYALVVSVILPLLDQSRKWEVYECIFALLSLAIFLNPANPLPHETKAKPTPEGATDCAQG